jgi:poly [ADP-ribose] polymerase
MSKKITKEARLIYAEFGENSNKFYNLWLYEDGTIESENGRVGVTTVRNPLPKLNGERDFERQLKSKIKKGYTKLKTIASTNAPQTVEVNNLQEIAHKQIQVAEPELQKLIDRLVAANVHKITSSTQITYNASTGLFSTPLGIVTLEAITDARNLLVEIKKYIKDKDHGNKALFKVAGQYLRLIPQNVGMKLDTRIIFADDAALQKQSDLLDSLESSYQALSSAPAPDKKDSAPEEKVFEVSLDLVEDGKEIDRINKFFRQTSQSQHVSSRLKIKQVYKLCLAQMAEAFKEGSKCGNIQELWHGTKKANLLSILKSGLRVAPPSTAAIAGKMFGNGIYFSDQSTKSLNYAYGYWDGKYEKDCFMLLNQVAMGKSYTPSGPSHALPKPGYDSTFAVGGKSGVANNEMIVYEDNRVNITHLVEFSE